MTVIVDFGTSFELALPNLNEADRPLRLLWVDPGSCWIGSPPSEVGRHDDVEGLFEATLSRGYWLAECLLTQAQYAAVRQLSSTDGLWPSMFPNNARTRNWPVESISWQDAQAFCQTLSPVFADNLPPGYEFNLPSEVQWEYACRAGTQTRYSFGDADTVLDDYAWHRANSDNMPHSAGERLPNRWGFFDMHGNVFEWCLDAFVEYPTQSCIDWIGRSGTDLRPVRGGSFGTDPASGELRCACRAELCAHQRTKFVGCRVCLRCANPDSQRVS